LRVVHAWWALPELGPSSVPPGAGRPGPTDQEATKLLEQFVEGVIGSPGDEPELAVVAVRGVAAGAALIEAAREADLLVVGSRASAGSEGCCSDR
jgi:nucleotide-binding universal stress UspA family protein